jgi:anti-anti-sigma factor
MEFVSEQSDGVEIVKLSGRLDGSNADAASERFADILNRGVSRLALDLTDLEYISSAGLRVLLTVVKRLQQVQGKMTVFGLNGGVLAVFSVSGFDTILPVEPDLAAAIAALR